MKKIAIIFASFIPTHQQLPIGEEFFHVIKQFFPNADIFTGINPSICTTEWVRIVQKYTNFFDITPPNLIITSDASAYQTALRIYKKIQNNYDYVYFIHTKGITTGTTLRKLYTYWLFENYQKIETLFNNYPSLGAYTFSLTPLGSQNNPSGLSNLLTKYFNFPCSTLEWFPMCSNFIIRGNIVNNFIHNTPNFLNTLLTSEQAVNGERYFFERDFIHITDKQGYFLGSYIIYNTLNVNGVNKHDVYPFYFNETMDWIKRNNLNITNEFIDYYNKMEKLV